MPGDGAITTQCEPPGLLEEQQGKVRVLEVSSAVSMSDSGDTGEQTIGVREARDSQSVASKGASNSRLSNEEPPSPKSVGFADLAECAGGLSNVSQADDDASRGGSPTKNVGFATDDVEYEVEKCPEKSHTRASRSLLVSRKSHFSRFMKGDTGQNGEAVSPRKAARKTLTDLMSKRKTGNIVRQNSSTETVRTRKTVGNMHIESYNDIALDTDDSATAPSGPVTRFPRAPSRVANRRNMSRSRSMSRGPRRGRERFRGVGAMFSTSKARNPPRPPRPSRDFSGVENTPAGSKSSQVLSLLRGKRPLSPGPSRPSESDAKAELLKCRSAEMLSSV